jgi:general secretion pathway protein D
MFSHNQLRALSALCAILIAIPPNLEARTKKGDKLVKQGQAAEARGEFVAALRLFEQAVNEDPSDTAYLMAMRRTRFRAGQSHVEAGARLRAEGKLEEALSEFQRAISIDPSSPIALQELRRTNDMIAQKGRVDPAVAGLTPAEAIRKDVERRVQLIQSPPELKPITPQISTLKMNNQPVRVLYETVAKLAGINVVFDSQMTARTNHNVDLTNIPLDEALDYIALLTKTFWKPVSTNTIFVTDDNVTKRRDYEDEVVKVFYINNTTSAQEFQEIATVIRSLTEIRRVFTYNAQRAMLVRGTRDQVALAEKLVNDLDRPKAEVVVDVIVMEASQTNTRDLALALGAAGTATGLNFPISFTRGATGTTSPSVPLDQINRLSWSDWSTTFPGAIIQAFESDRRARVLQSPQVRASDGMKVSLRLGDRIPYATGSFQPGVGGVGVNPLVSTQFNFADVGVNVDITPQVHGPEELTLHVELEVSAVRERVVIGGIEQPVIGQRKSVADLRLRSGEISLLGGNQGSNDSRNANGLPGLVSIPALGWLGGQTRNIKERTELLIALLPRVIRVPDYTLQNTRSIYAGSDQVIKLNYAQPAAAAAIPGAPSPSPVAIPPAATPDPAKPAEPAKPEDPKPAPPKPAGLPRVALIPPSVQTQLSSAITISVGVENLNQFFSAAPLRVKYDPAIVRLADVQLGNFAGMDGQTPNLIKDIRNDTGEATVTISRAAGAGGVTGSGVLLTLLFQAVGKGTTQVTFPEFALKDAQMQPLPVSPAALAITVN